MKRAVNDFDMNNRCSVDLAINLVGGKWKSLILYRLREGSMRFGQLQRAIPEATQRMLTLHLRALERDGLITRKVYAEVPPRVVYTLTEPALQLVPILESMGLWLREHYVGSAMGHKPEVEAIDQVKPV
jgi:DNA-binding HxlR family transcriptional regulator